MPQSQIVDSQLGKPLSQTISSQPSQPSQFINSQPSQLLSQAVDDKLSQPSQPVPQPIDFPPVATDEKYDYFTRDQVAKYMQVERQKITDAFAGKSKTMAKLLQKNGFEYIPKPPSHVPKTATIRRLKPS